MKNITSYTDFIHLNEEKINEAKGIHPAIRAKLISFINLLNCLSLINTFIFFIYKYLSRFIYLFRNVI